MNYYVVCLHHHLEDFAVDLLQDDLASLGFESFETEEALLKAYIPAKEYDDRRSDIDALLASVAEVEDRTDELIPDRDWNAVWESQYDPVRFGNFCLVHAPFHEPSKDVLYNIEIEPKMSFGTAHHPTTSLMIRFLEENPPKGEDVLDMGCGTAVLGILAAMQGAGSVDCIDIDEWAYRNAVENAIRNGFAAEAFPKGTVLNIGSLGRQEVMQAMESSKACHKPRFRVFQGDAGLLEGARYDRIVANINRNILLRDMSRYADCLQAGGLLYLSGFYLQDMELLEQECNAHRLFYRKHLVTDSWTAIEFYKK